MSPERVRSRQKVLIVLLDVAFVLAALGVPVLAKVGLQELNPPAAAVETPLPPLPDLALVKKVCDPLTDRDAKRDCFVDAIRPVLASHGVAIAFSLLENLTTMDSFVYAEQHPMAHELGRDAYFLFKDAPAIAAECPYTMASGCFHGDLEAFLGTRTSVSKDEVEGLCKVVAQKRDNFGYFQCLHGLGHGLDMALGHNWTLSLTYCDLLSNAWERESCYGGVFMENIVSYQLATGLGVGEGLAHSHGGIPSNGTLYPDNPQYPCDQVAEKFKSACFMMQSSVYLTLNHWDIPTAFRWCDEADRNWTWMCYLSMGRDISSWSKGNDEEAVRQCDNGDPKWESWCITGVEKDYVNSDGSTARGRGFCKVTPDPFKKACYEALGMMMVTLYPATDKRWTDCGLVEADYIGTCRKAAGV